MQFNESPCALAANCVGKWKFDRIKEPNTEYSLYVGKLRDYP